MRVRCTLPILSPWPWHSEGSWQVVAVVERRKVGIMLLLWAALNKLFLHSMTLSDTVVSTWASYRLTFLPHGCFSFIGPSRGDSWDDQQCWWGLSVGTSVNLNLSCDSWLRHVLFCISMQILRKGSVSSSINAVQLGRQMNHPYV